MVETIPEGLRAPHRKPGSFFAQLALLMGSCGTSGFVVAEMYDRTLDHREAGYVAELAALHQELDFQCGEGYAEWVLLGRPRDHETRSHRECRGAP